MFKGFLWIGDPHLSSKVPGYRIDDYPNTVLGKMRQAGVIAKQLQLVPVILGDLIHRAHEENMRLLNRLVDIIREEYPCKPVLLDGNHGKVQKNISEDDALALLGKMDLFHMVNDKGFVGSYTFEGQQVHLWATPHGTPIDKEIDAKEGVNIMITHHDLAFQGAYPGAALLHEITGCDMVVNGHMHKTTPSVTTGATVWHNPGNIARLSRDTKDHIPSVWEWTPSLGKDLVQHRLEFEAEVFDMAGMIVEAASNKELKASLPRVMQVSQFAKLIEATNTMESGRSETGEKFVEDLKDMFDEVEAPMVLRALVGAMAQEVVKEAQQ